MSLSQPTKPLLIFSHANGFSASTYRKLFGLLEADFTIAAVERFGHTKQFPVTNNWPYLLLELEAFVEQQLVKEHKKKVLLLGHSMGGFLSLMLAYKRPELVERLVLLDSPIVAGRIAFILKVVKTLGVDERFSPARFAKVRRTHWPSLEAVEKHFASKAFFKRWDLDMLRDYATHGTHALANGNKTERELSFSREVEYSIFRCFPDNLGRLTRKPVPVPFGFVVGTQSDEARHVGLGNTRKLVGTRMLSIEGGHLFPMEQPIACAQAVRQLLLEPL